MVCALGAALLSGCGSSTNVRVRTNSNADSGPTIAITVGKSESRDVAAVIQATGSLIASETSDVAPKAAGKVDIKAGDVSKSASQLYAHCVAERDRWAAAAGVIAE